MRLVNIVPSVLLITPAVAVNVTIPVVEQLHPRQRHLRLLLQLVMQEVHVLPEYLIAAKWVMSQEVVHVPAEFAVLHPEDQSPELAIPEL